MERSTFKSFFYRVTMTLLGRFRLKVAEGTSTKLMGTRWKTKGSEAKALSEPMSKIISELQSALIQSESRGFLSGSNVLLCLDPQLSELLHRACFGILIRSSSEDKRWFQLEPFEAFYLAHALKCLVVIEYSSRSLNEEALWKYMKSRRENFSRLYKAYASLRSKNWVVMSGVRYGMDFVVYRHHPGLVHSEFAVLVMSRESGGSGGDNDDFRRLSVWSDVLCTSRVCGGVAKTLLVMDVCENGLGDSSPSCLEGYSVGERTITRWVPEKCSED